MLRTNHLLAFLAASALSLGPAYAQEVYKSEASVQIFGTFTSTTWDQGVRQTATDSGGILGSYRYFFNDYNGLELNYGFAEGTQKYLAIFGPSSAVRANSHEATAAYVLRYPVHRVVPFLEIGTGALVFDPLNGAPPTTEAKAAFVYGGGIDVGFAHRCFLRAEYRGLVYDTPDFNTFFLGPQRITNRAEPTIGFGIKF